MRGTGEPKQRARRGGAARAVPSPCSTAIPSQAQDPSSAEVVASLHARVAALEAQLAAQRAESARAEADLRRNQALLQAIIDYAPHSITVQDLAEGRYLLVNRRQEELTGRGRDELVGRTLTELLPTQAPAWREQDRRIAASGDPLQIEDVKRHDDGSEQFFLGLKFPLRDATGAIYAIGGIFQDITARKRMERALHESEDRHRSVVEALQEGVVVLDSAGLIRSANPSAEQLLGLPLSSLYATPLAERFHGAIRDDGTPFPIAEHPVLVALHTGTGQSGVVLGLPSGDAAATRWLTINARPLCRPGDDRPHGAVGSFTDITARRTLEARLRHRATHDSLTALPNRAHFLALLERALAPAEGAANVGVLYLDLDRFKAVNDTYGHAVGDELLAAVAARLRACLRAIDSVARLGGDEFTVCLPQITGRAEAMGIAERIVRSLSAPYRLDHHELRMTPSIGLALGVPGLHAPAALLRQADAALYQAKAQGRGRYVVAE